MHSNDKAVDGKQREALAAFRFFVKTDISKRNKTNQRLQCVGPLLAVKCESAALQAQGQNRIAPELVFLFDLLEKLIEFPVRIPVLIQVTQASSHGHFDLPSRFHLTSVKRSYFRDVLDRVRCN